MPRPPLRDRWLAEAGGRFAALEACRLGWIPCADADVDSDRCFAVAEDGADRRNVGRLA